ncbi:MAG: hypothetical protein ACRBN8_08565 [Nannocystales bacterium]
MKRTCLLSTAAILATLTTSSVAYADTKPAIVWVPTADIELIPSGTVDSICQKMQMSGSAVAAGCVAGLEEPITREVSADAMMIAGELRTAFADYDLNVVVDPPPAYVPVFALLTSDNESEESGSYTCGSQFANCSGLSRDATFSTNAGTITCTDPDAVQAAVYAVGRLAGLEGKDDPMDAMHYPPDYTMPVITFNDECGPISQQLRGEDKMTEVPLECTSLDHVECEGGEQNSHADLLENLGANAADSDAPVIAISSPADGDVIAEGGAISVAATVEEASNFAAVRITIASPALEGVEGITGGEISFCTTDICDVNFLENEPFKTADSGWETPDIGGLPGGEYTITLEGSDYYGNEAEAVTVTVTLEGGPIDPSGGDTDGGSDSDTTDPTGASDTNDTFVSGGDESSGGSDTDGGGDGGASDDGGGGCSVGSRGVGGSFAMMLGLLGLGLLRRRD